MQSTKIKACCQILYYKFSDLDDLREFFYSFHFRTICFISAVALSNICDSSRHWDIHTGSPGPPGNVMTPWSKKSGHTTPSYQRRSFVLFQWPQIVCLSMKNISVNFFQNIFSFTDDSLVTSCWIMCITILFQSNSNFFSSTYVPYIMPELKSIVKHIKKIGSLIPINLAWSLSNSTGKNCSPELAPILTRLFQISYKVEYFLMTQEPEYITF